LHKEEEKNKIEENINNTWIIHPFTYRQVQKALVMITPTDAEKNLFFKFYTDEDLAKTNLLVQMRHTLFTLHNYRYWNAKQKPEKLEKMDFLDIKIELGKSTFYVKKYFTKKEMEENIKRQIENIPSEDMVSKESSRMLYGIISPYFASLSLDDKEEITFLYIPIASSTVFYGNLCLLPHFELVKDEETIKQLVHKVFKCIEKYYVPALALIHEHFYEKLVSSQIKKFVSQKVLTDDEKSKQLLGKPYAITPQIQIEYAKEKEFIEKLVNLPFDANNFPAPIKVRDSAINNCS
jgi:hypothetical protein